MHGFTGYFMLYSVPFKYLPLFDYSEKRSIWKEGLLRGRTIFNDLDAGSIPYYVHESGTSDEARLDRLKERIIRREIAMGYVSLGRLDALMHKAGNAGPQVTELVRWYDARIREVIAAAENGYDEVEWYLFTDHGMHNTTGEYDLIRDINALDLLYGKDYVAFYDATMARVWFLNDDARRRITAMLATHSSGRIIPDEELKQLGVFFEDRMYGELIFLMNSGIQLVPSFMGNKRVAGLHGFHPHDTDSRASLLSNRTLPGAVRSIHQIYGLMQTATVRTKGASG